MNVNQPFSSEGPPLKITEAMVYVGYKDPSCFKKMALKSGLKFMILNKRVHLIDRGDFATWWNTIKVGFTRQRCVY
jgi:hypothetical protein